MPDAGTKLDDLQIEGRRESDTDVRALSTTVTMVFGREELDRHGDTTIGEVLKRLPGIVISGVPGRGGDIRMRGLGRGYTQILVNGEPAPRGFTLDGLAPEQVERIEILRAPIAEQSARAIAGTVNIVLREGYEKRSTEFRLQDTIEQDRSAPGASVARSDVGGSFSYHLGATVQRRDQESESVTLTRGRNPADGSLVLDQAQQDLSRNRGTSLSLTSRITWRPDAAETFTLRPFATVSRASAPGTTTLEQTVGATNPPYTLAAWRNDADTGVSRLFSSWQHRLDENSKFTLRAGYGLSSARTGSPQTQWNGAGGLLHVLDNTTDIHDRTASGAGKYEHWQGADRKFAAGWEAEYGSREESAASLLDGVDQLGQFGGIVSVSTLRVAGFAQQERRFGPQLSGYAGLRWEQIRTRSDWSGQPVRSSSALWSPMLQGLWHFQEDGGDQARLALSRTYRSPALGDLVGRPVLSTQYPASGPNTPTSPDKAGNPGLAPEVAWGLDLAVEHYFDSGGLLSANVFSRNIDRLMRSSTALQTVAWSTVPRWVTEPANAGKARSRGIELEARFSLASFGDRAPPIELRANASRFWSAVEGISGPDNRLDQQPKATANIGFDVQPATQPWSLGANANWTSAFRVQESNTQVTTQGRKFVADAYATWKFSRSTRLRVSGTNLLHRNYETGNEVSGPTIDQSADTVARTFATWSARLEIRL